MLGPFVAIVFEQVGTIGCTALTTSPLCAGFGTFVHEVTEITVDVAIWSILGGGREQEDASLFDSIFTKELLFRAAGSISLWQITERLFLPQKMYKPYKFAIQALIGVSGSYGGAKVYRNL